MNDEIKNQIKAIVAEAQRKVDSLFPGLRITVLVPAEPSEEELVQRALCDRQNAGLSAGNAPEFAAALTLDGVSRAERELIEWALQESSALEVEK
jgi:hypothetical protein